MKIKALWSVVYNDTKGKRKVANPGEVIELEKDLAERLVAQGAASAIPGEQEGAASPRTSGRGRNKSAKKAEENADIEEAEKEAEEVQEEEELV